MIVDHAFIGLVMAFHLSGDPVAYRHHSAPAAGLPRPSIDASRNPLRVTFPDGCVILVYNGATADASPLPQASPACHWQTIAREYAR